MRVHLTGFGLHTALARGVDANADALTRGPQPPREVPVQLGDAQRDIPYYLLADAPLGDMDTRFEQVLHGVIDEALQGANLSRAQRRTMGFFLGSSCGEMPVLEAHYRRDLRFSHDALPMLQTSSQGNLANRLRAPFGIQGPDYSYYTACTASANALIAAAHMLRTGRLRHAIVVGVEMFNAVTALGFAGLQLITRDVMRPFDRRRAGLVPGEGCAAVVLSTESNDSHWRFLGGANLCDTHSISATNPDGSAIAEVVQRALSASNIALEQLAALKAHGTASLLNDEAEAAGLHRVFAQMPSLCALKPYIGHTYGACGVVELALFCASVDRGSLPATPGIAVDSDLDVSLNQTHHAQVPGKFMLNYFGFGGSNSSLVVANDNAGINAAPAPSPAIAAARVSPAATQLPSPSPAIAGEGRGGGSKREAPASEAHSVRPLTPTLSPGEREAQEVRSQTDAPIPRFSPREREIYIAASADYVEPIDSDTPTTDLKALVADAVGTPVRRIGRFIQLALIGAGRCTKSIELPTQTAVYLGSARGDLEVAIDVMQSLIRDGQAPKPLSFINTVSNAASFYVAQSLKLMSRSTFVCNRYFAFETLLQLAALDLDSGLAETALLGAVDIVMPPLAAHRTRLGLGSDTSVADASHWLFLQTQRTDTTLGRLIATETFVDAHALRGWLTQQALETHWRLACGQFMPQTEADEWQRTLGLKFFDYRADRAYYDSQSGAAISEFLRQQRGTLLHLNRDPSGRYVAVVVETVTRD